MLDLLYMVLFIIASKINHFHLLVKAIRATYFKQDGSTGRHTVGFLFELELLRLDKGEVFFEDYPDINILG